MALPGNVTGAAFTYAEMREKLKREIGRLRSAESARDETAAMDHALNAAFTAYHLLEWQAKEASPSDTQNARTLLNAQNNADLELLHDIATRTKHVTISNSATGGAPVDVRTSAFSGESIGSLGDVKIGDVADYNFDSIVVKFADRRAVSVLSRVADYFPK